jgi:hypothetical protein
VSAEAPATAKKPRAKVAVKKQMKVQKQAAPKADAAASITAPPQSDGPVAMEGTAAQAWGSGSPAPAAVGAYTPRVNPYLSGPQAAPVPSQPLGGDVGQAQGIGGPRFSLPHIPLFEQSILPKVQTVYPTGEKPLVVVTFKCPTELVGIDTPSTLILHKVVNGGMDLINKTNLLSFNMQQVCQ